MGTLMQQQQPFSLRTPGDGLSRPMFGGFSLKERSPSPSRRRLFPDSTPRRLSSTLATPIQESSSSYRSTTSSSFTSSVTDGLPPRKFSGLVSSLEESSRRSSRATSPFDEYGSRRSSRATSPFTDEFGKHRRSSRLSRSSRGSSPFEDDVPRFSRSKSPMLSFIESLRSRTPSPSGRSSADSPPRRRSSSVFSDVSRRLSNSPYHTLPRRRSQSPDVRAMSLTSDSGHASLSNYSNGSYSEGPAAFSKNRPASSSPSANANGARVDRAIELLRRLSEDWSINTEKEEEENQLDQLTNQTNYYNYFNRTSRHPYRRSSSTNSHNYTYVGNNNNNNNGGGSTSNSYINGTSNSNNSSSSDTNSYRSGSVDSNRRPSSSPRLNDNALAIASHLIEIANRRSPSPPKFATRAKSPFEFNTAGSNVPNGYSNPLNGGNNTYYNNSNGYNNQSPFLNSNVVTAKPPPAYSFYKPASNIGQGSLSGNSGPLSAPARLDEKEKYFLPFTFPEQFPYKIPSGMATNGSTSPAATPLSSSRRFSDENSFRRPLATLHEDEVMARRRFSEDVRKNYYDTSEVADELYRHQRRLSEAGVRKISDASVVLTEDTDKFMIGQRVWVGGSKPGVISFIGETQFAPGDWAGVTLDEPIGKNDGSVAGVRYFQCEAKKGVFSRLTRLSFVSLYPDEHDDREQHEPKCARSSLSPARSVTSSGAGGGRSSITPTRRVSPPASVKSAASSTARTTPSMGPPTGASVARKVSNPVPAAPSLSSYGNLTVGDRVVVNSKTGTRVGTLRHLGKTEFADGLWAGVELDEPSGKNDGSVAGKKYFTCKSMHGLFSPLQCVTRVGGPSPSTTARRASTAATPTSSRTPASGGLRRSNSRESLGGQSVASSVGASSVASSVRPAYRKTSYGATNTAARLSTSRALQVYEEELDLDGFY